jgi:hypothetical protein
MSNRTRTLILIATGVIVTLAIIVLVTSTFIPQENPAFAAAVAFVQAVGSGDDSAANALMTADLQAFVTETCPDGLASRCVEAYIPDAWGEYLSVVFRRAAPISPDWNVDLIATYALDRGFSGVCIHTRMTEIDGTWKVASWAGFVHCGDPASRNMAGNPDAPNRAP